jgi:hypothetical protein
VKRSTPTIEELPPTLEELSIIALYRAIEISRDEAIVRLSHPVFWDEEGRGWTRKPRARELPEGWKVVG